MLTVASCDHLSHIRRTSNSDYKCRSMNLIKWTQQVRNKVKQNEMIDFRFNNISQ